MSWTFRFSISAERVDLFDDTDIVLGYSNAEGELLNVLRSDTLLSRMAPVQTGAVVSITNGTPLSAALSPSPLGIPWSLDQLITLLAEAAENAG